MHGQLCSRLVTILAAFLHLQSALTTSACKRSSERIHKVQPYVRCPVFTNIVRGARINSRVTVHIAMLVIAALHFQCVPSTLLDSAKKYPKRMLYVK